MQYNIFLQRDGRYGYPLFWLLAGCNSKHPNKSSAEKNKAHQQQRIEKFEQQIYKEVLQKVETGDLVLRLGSDITSEMFRQMNKTDKSFSHCGIASIENDSVFVYHAIGGEFNPNQKLKRELLFSFGHAADNKSLAIFRPTTTLIKRKEIAKDARTLFLQGISFDMQFDYQTDDRLYCAEFVSKCISRCLEDSSWLSFSNTGKLRYVAIDNLFLTPIMQEQMRWIY